PGDPAPATADDPHQLQQYTLFAAMNADAVVEVDPARTHAGPSRPLLTGLGPGCTFGIRAEACPAAEQPGTQGHGHQTEDDTEDGRRLHGLNLGSLGRPAICGLHPGFAGLLILPPAPNQIPSGTAEGVFLPVEEHRGRGPD